MHYLAAVEKGITVEIEAFDIKFDMAKLEKNVKIKAKAPVRTLAPATGHRTTDRSVCW
jgi:hypothetical protein